MLKVAALVLVSIPVLLLGACLSSSYVIVDVKPDDGPRIIVPVPLMFARAAFAFAPDEAKHIEIPELAEFENYADLAEEIIDELIDAPDGVLVEVHDGDDHVVIAKAGDEIEVNVNGDNEEVSLRLPLPLVADILDSFDGEEIETGKILAALSSFSRKDLVHVRTEDEEVRIWLW
jgi:hypothetical protein